MTAPELGLVPFLAPTPKEDRTVKTPTADTADAVAGIPEQEQERICRRAVDGLPAAAVAREFGRTPDEVRAVLVAHGVPELPPRVRREPLPVLPPRTPRRRASGGRP